MCNPYSPGENVALTILMPCLDEIETLAICITKATAFLAKNGINGEVLIADNGSTDGSIDVARNMGARVVDVPVRGYGSSLMAGIDAAAGEFVVMGDSDDSYDFSNLMPFLDQLQAGADLVMGNRFKGGISPGAMPFLHRYLGNPVLSFVGRLFFRIPIGDFHCGLRAFRTEKIRSLKLRATGMEFASEMVVKASLAKLLITEVPTTLRPDGRSRSPHLRTWRDGWRHLRLLLIYSPRWLFLYPGIVSFLIGTSLTLALLPGPLAITSTVTLDIHSIIVGCLLILIGSQAVSFAVLARRYSTARGLLPTSHGLDRLPILRNLEGTLLVSLALLVAGTAGLVYSIYIWSTASFGVLDYGSLLRVLMPACSAIALAIQLGFTGFLSEIISIGTRTERVQSPL